MESGLREDYLSEYRECTTDPDELVAWLSGLETVTVFATYAAVGLGVLQRAHAAGLGVWCLMVVDEAHRTSGDGLKLWAAVHDQAQLPAERRLYMTATARVREAESERPRPDDTGPGPRWSWVPPGGAGRDAEHNLRSAAREADEITVLR